MAGMPMPPSGGKPDLAMVLDDPSKPPEMGDEHEISVDPSEVDAAAAVRAALESGDDEEFAKSLKGFFKLSGGV